MVIVGVRVWVVRGCVSVRPGFSMCRGGSWPAQELLVQLCECCLQGMAGQAGILSCPRRCAALGAVPHLGRDPGPRWHGVAWPMEVEVGIFSSGMDGFREMEGGPE